MKFNSGLPVFDLRAAVQWAIDRLNWSVLLCVIIGLKILELFTALIALELEVMQGVL
jgi:hypothetical protein